MGVKRQYSDAEKAAAMAALMAGQSLDAVAREYKIPKSTLDSWRNPRRPKRFETEKESEIGDLLIDYLRANLRALKAQAEVFTDPDWLAQQGAHEAAVLHGVMTDKAVRLIEAFSAHDSDTAPTD
jgi:transposase-like protein